MQMQKGVDYASTGVHVHAVLEALGELDLTLDEREEVSSLATADVLAGVDVVPFWRTRTSPAFTV